MNMSTAIGYITNKHVTYSFAVKTYSSIITKHYFHPVKSGSKLISSSIEKAVEKMISASKESISQTSEDFMGEIFKRTP